MADSRTTSKVSFLPQQETSLTHIGSIAIVGALVGIATWLLSMLFQATIVEPLFCRSADAFTTCNNGGSIAFSAAAIIAHIGGLYALVRIGTYRPLLVVLATIVTLWGIQVWLGTLVWFEATVAYGFVVAIAYALYAWLARIVTFWLSAVFILVVIILARVFLNLL